MKTPKVKLVKPERPDEPRFLVREPTEVSIGTFSIDNDKIRNLNDIVKNLPKDADPNEVFIRMEHDWNDDSNEYNGPGKIVVWFNKPKNFNYAKEKQEFDKEKAKWKILHDKWIEDMKEFQIKNNEYKIARLQKKVDKAKKNEKANKT